MLYITFYIFIVNYINILKAVTLTNMPYNMWFILTFLFPAYCSMFYNFQQMPDQFELKETEERQESIVTKINEAENRSRSHHKSLLKIKRSFIGWWKAY